jgi:hypothetical protein
MVCFPDSAAHSHEESIYRNLWKGHGKLKSLVPWSQVSKTQRSHRIVVLSRISASTWAMVGCCRLQLVTALLPHSSPSYFLQMYIAIQNGRLCPLHSMKEKLSLAEEWQALTCWVHCLNRDQILGLPCALKSKGPLNLYYPLQSPQMLRPREYWSLVRISEYIHRWVPGPVSPAGGSKACLAQLWGPQDGGNMATTTNFFYVKSPLFVFNFLYQEKLVLGHSSQYLRLKAIIKDRYRKSLASMPW